MKSLARNCMAAAATSMLAAACLAAGRPANDEAAKHGPIAWSDSLDKAEKVSARDGRPVMMDFWAEWCGPCKMMLATTYKDKAVVARSKRFVPVLVNVDKQPALAQKYGVEAIPTVIFVDGKGRVLSRSTGYMDSAGFLKLMADVEKKSK